MQLETLLKFDGIVIQCHDDPDADAIASGFALQRYLESQGKKAELVYSGPRKISKGNLIKMVELFDIGITYVEQWERSENPPELLITVDCQDGESNVTPLPRRELAVIDHHRAKCGGEQGRDTLREVRSDYGACSTILWCMLKDAGFELDKVLSSALYYGLYMDTSAFSRLAHSKDWEMRKALDEGELDRESLEDMKHANLNEETIRILGKAISELHTHKDYHFAVAQAEPCDPNILGVISDQVMEVENVKFCASYCLLPEEQRKQGKEFKFSVRSYLEGLPADKLAKYIASGLGDDAGGRKAAAAGTLSEQELRREISNTDEIGWDGFSSAVGRLIYRKIADYCRISYALRNTRPDFFQMVEKCAYLMQLHDQAEQGSSDAQYNLGLCYFYGDGVEEDFAQAAEWFRRAAEQGLAEAQSNFGVCCQRKGTEEGFAQAAEWFRRAAEQGHPEAQYNLALSYYNGDGVNKDLVQAAEWFRRAAEQGLANAQFMLGGCYYSGGGVEHDFKQAVEWFRKAAEQGLPEAQYYLGVCYYNGDGVGPDRKQAEKWIREAAEQGYPDAQQVLAQSFGEETGVPQDQQAKRGS